MNGFVGDHGQEDRGSRDPSIAWLSTMPRWINHRTTQMETNKAQVKTSGTTEIDHTNDRIAFCRRRVKKEE